MRVIWSGRSFRIQNPPDFDWGLLAYRANPDSGPPRMIQREWLPPETADTPPPFDFSAREAMPLMALDGQVVNANPGLPILVESAFGRTSLVLNTPYSADTLSPGSTHFSWYGTAPTHSASILGWWRVRASELPEPGTTVFRSTSLSMQRRSADVPLTLVDAPAAPTFTSTVGAFGQAIVRAEFTSLLNDFVHWEWRLTQPNGLRVTQRALGGSLSARPVLAVPDIALPQWRAEWRV
jgi:hypothetical protein